MPTIRLSLFLACLSLLSGCLSAPEVIEPNSGHLGVKPEVTDNENTSLMKQPWSYRAIANIPAPVTVAATVPQPGVVFTESTHTVVVYDVPVSELLFSLARDSALNLAIDPGIDSTDSLNALEQPLTSILERIGEVADIRYDIEGDVLRVRRDLPYIKSYTVDYLNIARSSIGSVAVSTQISATGQGAGEGGAESGAAGNNSDTVVRNVAEHVSGPHSRTTLVVSLIARSAATAAERTPTSSSTVSLGSWRSEPPIEHAVIEEFLAEVQGSTQRQV